MRTAVLLQASAAALVTLLASAAHGGSITAQGNVVAITERNQIPGGLEGRFDEGQSGNVPLDLYAGKGLTWQEGSLASILPGIVTTGEFVRRPVYDNYNYDAFPAPIGGGGEYTGSAVFFGAAKFSISVTRVGLTASKYGPQHLTAFRANGTMIGQISWVPNNDSTFLGLATFGEPIALVIYGPSDLLAGETYHAGNPVSDTWVWGSCNKNGVLDPGEQCDDGNALDGDGCSANCGAEYCGNGLLDAGEACEDGNAASGDGCSSDCQSQERCGNLFVDIATGEACDDGNTVDGDGCQADCSLPSCGDGIVDPDEACDDGNRNGGDGCNATCTSDEACGNGIVDVEAGEQCDDGSASSGDGCSSSCQLEICGNDAVDPGEACDDGNTLSGDGCSSDCESDETCGNGIVDAAEGEQCDDGNTVAGDGCAPSCVVEYCGNGENDPGEICDDGNTSGGDGCSADCSSDETCGNGFVDTAAGEQCDLGTENGKGACSATCAIEASGEGGGEPMGGGSDVGGGADVDDGGGESGGCDCRASAGASTDGRAWAIGLLGALLGLARRRRG